MVSEKKKDITMMIREDDIRLLIVVIVLKIILGQASKFSHLDKLFKSGDQTLSHPKAITRVVRLWLVFLSIEFRNPPV